MKISSVRLCESHLANPAMRLTLCFTFSFGCSFLLPGVFDTCNAAAGHMWHISQFWTLGWYGWYLSQLKTCGSADPLDPLDLRLADLPCTVAKFGDPCRKSIPCAILIDTFDTGSRPPSSICQVRVVGGRYGQIDCKGEMIEDASACDHYDHGFYMILPYSTIKQPLGIIEYWIVFDDIWWYLMYWLFAAVSCCPLRLGCGWHLGPEQQWTAPRSTNWTSFFRTHPEAQRLLGNMALSELLQVGHGDGEDMGRHGETIKW